MSEKQTTQTPTVAPTLETSRTVDVRKALFDRLEITNLPRDVLIDAVVGAEGYGHEEVETHLEELKQTGEVYVVPINDGRNQEVRRT